MAKYPLVDSVEKQIVTWQKHVHFFTDKKFLIPTTPQLTEKELNGGWQIALFFCLGTTQKNIEKTLELSWTHLQSKRKTWSSDNIFNNTRYKLSFKKPKLRTQGFYWKKIQISSMYQGLSVQEARCLNKNRDVYIAGHEALQLLIINKVFSHKFDGVNIPFLHLGDVSLSNSKTTHDLERSVCLYTVGPWLVLDRLGTEYKIPWNSCVLLR